jgi:Tfp pilus assembly protein PilV
MILCPITFTTNHQNQRGFSYAEVLLSVILLAILLVPAMQALNAAITGGSSNVATKQLALRSKMEEVLSKPYNTLYAETSLSGGNTITSVSANLSDTTGATDRRVVVLYRFDTVANALSATDTGVLYVSVYYEAEGSTNALNTLVGRWW